MSPLFSSFPIDSGGPATRRNWLWFGLQQLFRVFTTVWIRFRARGVERLPATAAAVLLSNHQSFLDPLLIGLPLRRPVSFLARDSLFRVPVIGWILRSTHVVPLNRETGSASGLREVVRRLEQGFLVGVFPEGTRSSDGRLGEIKPGFAALIRRTDAPIYPVGIAGAHQALGRGQWFIRPARVCVVFGDPLDPQQIASLKQRGRENELLAVVGQRIAECQAEAEQWLRR